MGRMSLSIYMKGDYEDLCGFGLRKNKANSKPNKANFIGANYGFVIPVEYVLSCGKTIPKAFGFEAATQ